MVGMDIAGVRVIITGATGAIGMAVARGFLEHGAFVANWDLVDSEETWALQKQYGKRYLFCETNIKREGQVQAAAESTARFFDGIDVLVNNAGLTAKQELERVQEAVLDRLYQVNVKGLVLTTKHVAPWLKESGRGRIINLSAAQAAIGMETYSPYACTKAAVSGLTRVWAQELAAYGVTVNTLCPGWADTEMTRKKMVDHLAEQHGITAEAAMEMMFTHVPRKRLVQVEEIAFATLYLASTLAGAVNGVELFLDGGLTHCASAGLTVSAPA